MKRIRSTWMISMVILAFAVVGAGPAAAAPGAGLAGSDHDFTGETALTQAIGLCTFCHTPHRAQTTRLLWNHTLSGETYTWTPTTTTTNGTPLPTFTAAWAGVSKNCLSCHDGTVAIGDVSWFDKAARVLLTEQHDQVSDPYYITFASGDGGGGDMSGNHPVAHPFPYNGAVSSYNGVTTNTIALTSGWKTDPQTLGIRLFSQSGTEVSAGAVEGSTGIECSSCHDPHNGTGVLGDYFLRGTLTGNDTDYICLKCHTK